MVSRVRFSTLVENGGGMLATYADACGLLGAKKLKRDDRTRDGARYRAVPEALLRAAFPGLDPEAGSKAELFALALAQSESRSTWSRRP